MESKVSARRTIFMELCLNSPISPIELMPFTCSPSCCDSLGTFANRQRMYA